MSLIELWSFIKNFFQNFLEQKKFHHFSEITDKGHSRAERVIGTIRNLLRKPVFKAVMGDWLSELPSNNKQSFKTVNQSIGIAPIQASKKLNEKKCLKFSKIKDKNKR